MNFHLLHAVMLRWEGIPFFLSLQMHVCPPWKFCYVMHIGFYLHVHALAVLQRVAQLSDVITNILCLPLNVGFEDVVNTCHHFSFKILACCL